MPEGRRPGSPTERWTGGGTTGPGRPGGTVRPPPGGGRDLGPRVPAGRRAERRPGPVVRGCRPGPGGHQQRPLPPPGPPSPGHRHGGGEGPPIHGGTGRLASAHGIGPPALRGGAGPPLRTVAVCSGERCRPGCPVCLRPPPGGPGPAALPVPRRAGRDVTPAPAGRRWGHRPLRRAHLRTRRRGMGPDRPGAGCHCRPRIPRLFPRGVGHRGVLPAGGDPLPGTGVGGQLGRLLRAGHHQRRRGGPWPAVRAVPLPGARRAA